jgi:S-formylglutathione hydrolase FrmB
MVGVSMGGFGALHYAASFPSRIDGVLALAPHLGEETVLQQLRDAGGLERWQPPDGRGNYTVNTWRWLKRQTRVPIWVGYGEQDPITGQPLLLASALPREHVLHREGGHTWSTWRKLWTQFLDAPEFRERCGLTPSLEASTLPKSASPAAAP